MSRRVALAIVLSEVVALGGGAAQAMAGWQPAAAISDAGADAGAPQVAFDKKGNALAVWYSFDGVDGWIDAAVRPKDGTFTPAEHISAAGALGSPQVAFDKKGNALAVWERNDGADVRIEAAFRDKDGSFMPAEQISGAGRAAHSPQVAFDRKGNALAAWKRSDGTNVRIEAAFRPKDGSFTPAGQISRAGQDAYDPQVAFDKWGNALAAWNTYNTTYAWIDVALRERYGVFWDANAISSSVSSVYLFNRVRRPQVVIDTKGVATVVWTESSRIMENRHLPNLGRFDFVGNPISTDAVSGFEEPTLAIDRWGSTLAVWSGTPPGTNGIIEAAFRPVGEDYFSPQEPISAAAAEQVPYDPQAAFDPKGNALVVWIQENELGTNAHVEAAFRTRGGSFAPGEQISGVELEVSNPHVAFDKRGNALAVWEYYDGTNYRVAAAFRSKD